jgi:hypothetical protein
MPILKLCRSIETALIPARVAHAWESSRPSGGTDGNMPVSVHGAKGRARGDRGGLKPGAERADQAGIRVFTERRGEGATLMFLCATAQIWPVFERRNLIYRLHS